MPVNPSLYFKSSTNEMQLQQKVNCVPNLSGVHIISEQKTYVITVALRILSSISVTKLLKCHHPKENNTRELVKTVRGLHSFS